MDKSKLRYGSFVLGLLLVSMSLLLSAAASTVSIQQPEATVAQSVPPIPVTQPVQQTQPSQAIINTLPEEETAWFTIFNVSNKAVPGAFYAYSITGNQPGCVSSCTQMALPEAGDGVSLIPTSCRVDNCALTVTIFLQGKPAGESCTNINLTNISELWIRAGDNRFSATCQPFYSTSVVPPA